MDSNDDYMSGGSPSMGKETASEGAPKDEGKGEDDGSENFLIPKGSIKGDVQPGQSLTVKVVKIYGDEIEVQIQNEGDKESAPKSAMDESMGSMDSMAEPQA